MTKSTAAGRKRGHIRQRGGSFQVLVYAGTDPLTGKPNYLTESTRTRPAAEKALTRLLASVDAQRSPRTKADLDTAMKDWLRTHEAEETTLAGYRGYVERTISPALGTTSLAKITPKVLEEFYAELRTCGQRCHATKVTVDHRTTRSHDCRSIRHKRRPGRPSRTAPHDCAKAGCVVVECPPHVCSPMARSTIRQIHWILSAVFSAAVRWEWIASNPADNTRKPRQQEPQPEPPSAAEAARIVEAAWQEDDAWGTLVWLVMVTGLRRAELLALRWTDVDFEEGKLEIRRNYVRIGKRGIEKDTKSHQMRRISLDAETVSVLAEHRDRCYEQLRSLGITPSSNTFVFTYKPGRDAPADPSGVTHRYGRMCKEVEIDSHLHALRHYSATELLTAGVDLRTVAGRLGHGGGGATTLRVYAAWVGEADRKASEILGGRLKRPRKRVEDN